MPKGRGFLGCSQRTRPATPKGERCDRLTRALVAWLSPPLHRRRFPQALRYVDSLAHGEPERPSSPALKGGVFWRRKIIHERLTLSASARRRLQRKMMPCFGSTSRRTTSSTAWGPIVISRRCAGTSPPYATHSVTFVLRGR